MRIVQVSDVHFGLIVQFHSSTDNLQCADLGLVKVCSLGLGGRYLTSLKPPIVWFGNPSLRSTLLSGSIWVFAVGPVSD
jgi:hypothetical protein